jgi:hypothetical protein
LPDERVQPDARSHESAPATVRPERTARANDRVHRDENGRVNESRRPEATEHAREHGDSDVDLYRREHPGAAARCHDGFFTRTTDRRRACSRHGGIDVWL